MKKIKRYPGVQPFEAADRPLFFGRDEDIDNLYDLIYLEKVVVLFSKSGYGKSSLLNAGVIPRFQEERGEEKSHYHPILVRFGNYDAGNSRPPLEVLQEELEGACPQVNEVVGHFLDPHFKDPASRNGYNLWYQCKRRQMPGQPRPVFIFDQFEEFFTYPEKQQEAFKKELAELLYVRIPQALREKLPSNFGKAAPAEATLLTEDPDVKLLFAIRSDRMHHLDSLKDAIPDILFTRYELKALSRSQAEMAITGPAALETPAQSGTEEVAFATPPFVYSTAAMRIILDHLGGRREKPSDEIEAFELQLICSRIEQMVIDWVEGKEEKGLIGWFKKKTGKEQKKVKSVEEGIEIYPQDVPDLKGVFKDYYRQQIKKLDWTDRRPARLLIEDGLLSEDKGDGELRRLPVDREDLLERFRKKGATPGILQRLEDTFLVRSYPNNTGGVTIEISHDNLMDPIQESRERRRINSNLKAMAKWMGKGIGILGIGILVILLFLLVLIIGGPAFYYGKQVGKSEANPPMPDTTIIHDTIRLPDPSIIYGVETDIEGKISRIDSYLNYAEDFIEAENSDLARKAITEAESFLANLFEELSPKTRLLPERTKVDSMYLPLSSRQRRIEDLRGRIEILEEKNNGN